MSAQAKTAVRATLRELRLEAVARLQAAKIETPEADARILLRLALGIDDAALVAVSQMPISEQQQARFESLIARRIAGEPVARIIGHKEFWSRSFKLNADTLVPRPETETLVEAALAIFPERDAPLRVLDLGTGSGILLAAILAERPQASGIGVDRSESALGIARENLDALGLADRARLMVGDWSAVSNETFDLVVSNPPYIETNEILALAPEVREHDPHLALDGGADGLDAYRKIIAELPHLLSGNGAAVLELGIGQEAAVSELASAQGLFCGGPARRDLGGVPRALILYPRPRK